MEPIPINSYTESFKDMPPDKKLAFLQYILLKELYFDNSVKDWLREALKSEQPDPVRAMMLEAISAYIDEAEIRDELERLLQGLHPPESPLTYSAVKEILITALTDDMKAVKEWGTRLLKTHENVTPKNEASLCSFLAAHLKDENQPPRLRWHTALGLAHVGTPAAIENLTVYGRDLIKQIPGAPDTSENLKTDMDRFLLEKIAYSLGLAAEKVSACGKSGEALDLLKQAAERLDQDSDPLNWAADRLKAVPQSHKKKDTADIFQKIKQIPEIISSLVFHKFMAVAAAACLVLFVAILYQSDSPISVNLAVIGNPAKAPVRMKGIEAPSETFELKPGGVLKSGDYFRIQLNTDKDAYVWVLLYDSSGEVSELFSDKIIAGGVLALPDENSGFQLDTHTGTETLLVLASKEPIEDFDEKMNQLKAAGISEAERIFPQASVQSFSFEHQ